MQGVRCKTGFLFLFAFLGLSTLLGFAQETTVRVATALDSPKAEAFFREQMDVFMERNPDIKVELLLYPGDQYTNALQLLFSSDDAPDVMRVQFGGLNANTVYSRGWLSPLDGYFDEAFFDRFPEGTFDPVTSGLYFDGQLYALPLVDPRWVGLRVLYYNPELLAQYGFESPPETFSELENIAATVTEQGNGRVYGYALLGTSINDVDALSTTAGGSGGATGNIINFKTGEPRQAEEAVVSTVEFLRKMNADGVFTPGWESWDGAQQHQQFALGRLAMFISGPWAAAQVRSLNPDMEIGVAPVPVPDAGRAGYFPINPSFAGFWGMSSRTQHPEAAAKVLDFFGSVDFQAAFVETYERAVVLPQAYEVAEVNDDLARLIERAAEDLRVAPGPGWKHQDGQTLYSNISANQPQPLPRELYALAITRDEDYLPLGETYDEQLRGVVDEQLAQMKTGGSDIILDAFVFPDWNPLEDYQPTGSPAN